MTILGDELERMITERVRVEVARQLATARLPDEYLSAQDAAKFASVTDSTIRRWIRQGRLTEHRAGVRVRVARADLERMMKEGRRRPANEELTIEEHVTRRLAARNIR